MSHSGGTPTKDLSSDHNTSVDTESASAWVATLSNIFEKYCEFHVCLRVHLGYIPPDSCRVQEGWHSLSHGLA
jgi:hypothetical protein